MQACVYVCIHAYMYGMKGEVGQLLLHIFEDTDLLVFERIEISSILSSTSPSLLPCGILKTLSPLPQAESTPADTGTMFFETYVRDANPKGSPSASEKVVFKATPIPGHP